MIYCFFCYFRFKKRHKDRLALKKGVNESGFGASQGSKRVFCDKKDKKVSVVVNNNEHDSYTVHVIIFKEFFLCYKLLNAI